VMSVIHARSGKSSPNRTVRRVRLGVVSLIAVLACGGGSTAGPPPGGEAEVASIVVTASSDSLEVGKTLQLSASVRDAAGNQVAGQSFSWSSSNESFARVSGTGLVTGVGAGSADIRAFITGVSGEARIRITPRADLTFLDCGGTSSPSDVRATFNLSFNFDVGSRAALANVFAPKAGSQTASCPAVVLMPPGCTLRSDVDWAGPLLASYGYVVAVISLASPPTGDAVAECAALASGTLDYLLSSANPYRSDMDASRVGGIGYSQAGRVWVLVQDLDLRYRAIVAWDNLTKSELADQGSPSCASDPQRVRDPRAPAMGFASEDRCNVGQVGSDAKKTGYDHWRMGGMPTMEVVLEGSTHGDFAAEASPRKPYIVYYTRNWFDRWLKGDRSATQRLLTETVAPGLGATEKARSELLSTIWRSAAFLDQRDCPDLRLSCP
jgi:hypothetical protein